MLDEATKEEKIKAAESASKIIGKWKTVSSMEPVSPDGKTIIANMHNSNARLFAPDIKKLAGINGFKSVSFTDDMMFIQLK